jgi:hypothetical protein
VEYSIGQPVRLRERSLRIQRQCPGRQRDRMQMAGLLPLHIQWSESRRLNQYRDRVCPLQTVPGSKTLLNLSNQPNNSGLGTLTDTPVAVVEVEDRGVQRICPMIGNFHTINVVFIHDDVDDATLDEVWSIRPQ